MSDQPDLDVARRLNSIEGLHEAGIVDSYYFDPFTGLVRIGYTANWRRIVQSGLTLLLDPFFSAALLTDDPISMRMFVDREGARLEAEETQRDQPPDRPRRPRTRR